MGDLFNTQLTLNSVPLAYPFGSPFQQPTTPFQQPATPLFDYTSPNFTQQNSSVINSPMDFRSPNFFNNSEMFTPNYALLIHKYPF